MDYEQMGKGAEKPLKSYEESLREATELLQKTKSMRALGVSLRKERGVNNNIGEELLENMKKEKPEILRRFVAHGTSHGPLVDQLAAVLNTLDNGLLAGDYGFIKSIPGYEASLEDGFLIISQIDRLLTRNDAPKMISTWAGPRPANTVDVGAVAVMKLNLYPLVPALQERYPNVKILRGGDVADYLKTEAERTPTPQ